MLTGEAELILTVFAICFAVHLLFDFGFQGNKESSLKRGFNFWMISHSLKTSLAIIPALPILGWQRILLSFIFLFFSHLLIDNFRFVSLRHLELSLKRQAWWFMLGIDQILHLASFWLLFSFWLS